MMKRNMPLFILTQKQKKFLMKVVLMTYLNQFILRFYQAYKNILEKVLVGLSTHSYIILVIFRSTIVNMAVV